MWLSLFLSLSRVYSVLILISSPASQTLPSNKTDLETRSFYGDPERAITCLGSHYDAELPWNFDNPNDMTMQEWCAKTVYGGAPEGGRMGGWCSKGLPQKFENSRALSGLDLFAHRRNMDVTGVSFDWGFNSRINWRLVASRYALAAVMVRPSQV